MNPSPIVTAEDVESYRCVKQQITVLSDPPTLPKAEWAAVGEKVGFL